MTKSILRNTNFQRIFWMVSKNDARNMSKIAWLSFIFQDFLSSPKKRVAAITTKNHTYCKKVSCSQTVKYANIGKNIFPKTKKLVIFEESECSKALKYGNIYPYSISEIPTKAKNIAKVISQGTQRKNKNGTNKRLVEALNMMKVNLFLKILFDKCESIKTEIA